jgi:hypothetical protein
LLSCKREKNDFPAITELNIEVHKDSNTLVQGARVSVFEDLASYELAVSNRTFNSAVFNAFTDAQGRVRFELEPQKVYYVLITYFDNTVLQNFSNIGISGVLNPLPARANVFIKALIKPDDGNVIFYTTVPNKLPIEINIKPSNFQPERNFTLNSIFTANRSPNVLDSNVTYILRDPGSYTYYAKSSDGCVWQGNVVVEKGKVYPINLDKCSAGSLYFYTIPANDSLLPLRVTLNNIDEIGNITSASNLVPVCGAPTTNTLWVVRSAGLYNYVVRSASGRCVWTGTVQIPQDSCVVVRISECE